MMKRVFRTILVMASSSLLFACAGEKLELKVTARIDGQPAAQAKVTVDNEEQGLTNAEGTFSKTIRKKPGADVEVVVTAKEAPGYRIKPWKGAFLMKLPKSGIVDTYALAADLEATRYITIKATEKGAPVPEAVVKAAGAEAGKTDAQGLFVYEYKEQPPAGLDLAVTKSGYATWRKTGPVEPGQTIEAALSKRVIVTISALMEEYGQTSGMPGVVVSINKKTEGKTDAKGVFTYTLMANRAKKCRCRSRPPAPSPRRGRPRSPLRERSRSSVISTPPRRSGSGPASTGSRATHRTSICRTSWPRPRPLWLRSFSRTPASVRCLPKRSRRT